MRCHPTAPDQLFGRSQILNDLKALGPGRRVVLVAPPGVGRTSVVASYAQSWGAGTGEEVLWGRPDVEPLVMILTRWSAQLGLPPPGPLGSPRQVQDWSRRALHGRQLLVVMDAVPQAEQARVHALIIDGPTFVFVAERDTGWRAEPLALAPLDTDGVAEWLRAANPGIPEEVARSAAPRLAASTPALALVADALRGLEPAAAATFVEGVLAAAGNDLLGSALTARLSSWPELATWAAVYPPAGADDAARAAGPADADRPWVEAGLLRPAGDGRWALPASLAARVGRVSVPEDLRRVWVSYTLGAPDAPVEVLAAGVEQAGQLLDGEALPILLHRLIPPMMGAGLGLELLRLIGVWDKVAKAGGDLHAQALIKRHQGQIFAALGQAPRGAQFMETAVQLADQVGAGSLAAGALLGLAGMNQQMGFVDKAIAQFQEARRRFADVGERPGEAAALGGLGHALVGASRLEEAIPVFHEHAALASSLGDVAGQVANLRNEGLAWIQLGRAGEALAPLLAARAGSQGIGDLPGEAISTRALALCHAALGQGAEAEACWQALLPLVRALGDVAGEIQATRALAGLAGRRGDPAEQLRRLGEARVLAQGQLDALGEIEIVGEIAGLQVARGDIEAAIQTYRDQSQAAASGGMAEVSARALASAAPLLQRIGREDEARQMLQQVRRRLVHEGGKALGIIDGALFRLGGG